ncbi:hypothetical protein CCY01nite_33150 [Chitinophaga cymbidii]|uniref:Uncharacterized protein n=2 Tax=Chitinophaga cymbidii TaxID=1096750 RepID=A0A512RMX1_9BACT|nr:hypothetical protein CCY01nite_33150 [Chitinophaga cymbidii]
MIRLSFFCLYMLFAMEAAAQTAAATFVRIAESSSADTTIRIIITLDAPAADANVSITPLRYNKRFACSFTLDDGLVSAARVAFPFFNGGKVAPSFKDQWGFDQGADGAAHPGLFYTDGCGNPRPFTAAVAVNAHSVRKDSTPDAGNLSWGQLERMTSAGWDVLNHSFTHATGKDVKAAEEVDSNTSAVQRHLHTSMRQFVIPGGKDDVLSLPLYTAAAFEQGLQVVHSSRYRDYWIEPATCKDWDHLLAGRYFLHSNMKKDVFQEIAQRLETGRYYWLNTFTHSVGNDNLWNISFRFNDFSAFFNRLAAAYGKDGADNMWFAPPEAVHAYESLRRAVKPDISYSDNKLLITFDTNSLPAVEQHRALTFRVQGSAAIAEVSAENCTIESYGGKEKIINITW